MPFTPSKLRSGVNFAALMTLSNILPAHQASWAWVKPIQLSTLNRFPILDFLTYGTSNHTYMLFAKNSLPYLCQRYQQKRSGYEKTY